MANILALSKKYPNVPAPILYQYKDADKIIQYNYDDPDLVPIDVDVEALIKKNFFAECPGHDSVPEELLAGFNYELWDTIDNFGKEAKDQKIFRQKMPKKLVDLQNKCSTVEEIYDIIKSAPNIYQDEIAWMKLQWHRRIYGYWVFINGKPTYIDGWHYFYYNFWHLDVGLPTYKSRDKKFFIFARYCYRTTEAVYQFRRMVDGEYQYTSDESELKKWKTEDIDIEQGIYVVDTNSRTCYGFNYPKHRREGATYKADCILYEIISSLENARGGIQSMDGEHAETAFKLHVVMPWRKLPFFFRPKTSSSTSPAKTLVFEPPIQRSKTKGSVNTGGVGLDSSIDYATTAGRSAYDGEKLIFLHNDESGKTGEEHVYQRWQVQKQCLSQGNGSIIHGFTINTSTVGELTKKGGAPFFSWCKDSHWQNRNNANGQTTSGMFNLFIPAFDGLDGFIDEFGESIIETPTNRVVNEFGKVVKIGAKEYLEKVQMDLLAKGDPESILKYQENLRLFPTRFAHCFIASASDTGFNMKILSERISELMMNDRLQPVTGDFEWLEPFRSVKWVPSPTGKFKCSYIPSPEKQNLMIEGNDGQKYPLYPGKFIASGDPFRFTKTDGYRMSKGGGAVFWDFDGSIDDDKGINEMPRDVFRNYTKQNWMTNRYVCTYLNRVDDKDLYAEHMLRMCIFFGAMMYPENNVDLINEKFESWGFGGYLLYDFDPVKGVVKENAGFHSSESKKQDLFLGLKQYIEEHGHRESHLDLLMECKDIGGLEEMTKYDLFTAGGGCQLGRKSQYARLLRAHLGTGEESDAGSMGIDFAHFLF